MDEVTTRIHREVAPVRLLGGGFAALRIFSGVIWLSNGLAKAFMPGDSQLDWGFLKFNLINRPTAQGILDKASADTFQPLRSLYQDFVLANWSFFGWFLTVVEILVGLSLLFGVASRLGALVALLLIGPIWLMTLGKNLYLWEYPNELFPLLLLAIVPAGRFAGQDRKLAPRFRNRWPF